MGFAAGSGRASPPSRKVRGRGRRVGDLDRGRGDFLWSRQRRRCAGGVPGRAAVASAAVRRHHRTESSEEPVELTERGTDGGTGAVRWWLIQRTGGSSIEDEG